MRHEIPIAALRRMGRGEDFVEAVLAAGEVDEARGTVTVDNRGPALAAVRRRFRRRPRARPRPPESDRTARLRKLWAALHARPRLWTGAEAERRWLKAFARRVPCGDCRRHWGELLAARPPDLSSPSAYARWGHERHNDVRRLLKQEPLGYPEAAALWGWDRLADRGGG